MIRTINDVYKNLEKMNPCTVSFPGFSSKSLLKVIERSMEFGFISGGVLLGNGEKIKSLISHSEKNFNNFHIVNVSDEKEMMKEAIRWNREEKIDVLIKGQIKSAIFMKGILDRNFGLKNKSIISDCMFYEIPSMNRLLFITDPSINTNPNLNEKIEILKNMISLFKVLYKKAPRIAVLSYSETIISEDRNTIEASVLTQLANRGELDALIEGPLALDLAVNKRAAKIKGFADNLVAGNADIIFVPNLLSGNVLAKSLSFLTDYKSGGVLLGAKKEIVLTSRSSSVEEKVNSLAFASFLTNKRLKHK